MHSSMTVTAGQGEKSRATVGEATGTADTDHEFVLGFNEERREFEEHLAHTAIVDFIQPPAAFLVRARFMMPSFFAPAVQETRRRMLGWPQKSVCSKGAGLFVRGLLPASWLCQRGEESTNNV